MPQHILQGSVKAFSLAISLRMKRGAEAQLGATETMQGLPEFAGKQLIPVRHNALRIAMIFNHAIKEEPRTLFRSKRMSCGKQVAHLAELIHNHKDRTMTARHSWKVSNEISSESVPTRSAAGKGRNSVLWGCVESHETGIACAQLVSHISTGFGPVDVWNTLYAHVLRGASIMQVTQDNGI